MGWNLKAHILDHSAHTIDNLSESFDENNSKNVHFTLSIDVSQLIINHNCLSQKEIDKKMIAFLKDLEKHEHIFTESKGRYTRKDGTSVQRRREVLFNFDNTLMAYHNSGSDNVNSNNYSVNPHFHILCDEKKRLGKGYYQLRKAIEKVSKKHSLVFNLEEENEPKDTSLSNANSNFSWFTKRAMDSDFIKKCTNAQKIQKELNYVIQNYKNTGNIQYYVKTMVDFQLRLRRLKIDVFFEGVNLRKDFPLFLNDEQRQTLKILHQGSKDEIYEVLSQRENKIARAYIEYRYGFNNIVIDELKKRGFEPLKIDLDLEQINLKINKKQKGRADYFSTINSCYERDIKEALQVAKNEKELQLIMQNLGYSNFAYKQKTQNNKRQRVGFTFTNKNQKTLTVYFSNINLSIHDIRKELVENSKRQKTEIYQFSYFLQNYKPKKQPSKQNQKFEEIYKFDTNFDLSNWYVKELDSYVEFSKSNTLIVDNKNELIIKKQHITELENNAKFLIDIAIAKGWNLDNLHITGTNEFKLAIKNEILNRELQKLNEKEKIKALGNEPLFKAHKTLNDYELLDKLENENFKSKPYSENVEEFNQLIDIRQKAILKQDIGLLNRTYEVDEELCHEELRLKILNFAKVLNISKKDIENLIMTDNEINENEFDIWRENIKNLDNYDYLFLDQLTNQIDSKLTEHFLLNQDLTDNQLEKALKTMEFTHNEFEAYKCQWISKKEYESKLENINEHISSCSFYSAQKLISELDSDDKEYYSQQLEKAVDEIASSEATMQDLAEKIKSSKDHEKYYDYN